MRRTDEEIAAAITELKALATRLGHSPTEREAAAAGLNTPFYRYRWSNWNNALAAAGLPPRRTRIHRVTDEGKRKVIEKLCDVVERRRHMLSLAQIHLHPDLPSEYLFRRYFGSKDELLRQVIAELNRRGNTRLARLVEAELKQWQQDGRSAHAKSSDTPNR